MLISRASALANPGFFSLPQAWVANFERPRMNANSLLASPTGLSPYLRFGCLSCRLFYFKLTDLYRKVRSASRWTQLHDVQIFFFSTNCQY